MILTNYCETVHSPKIIEHEFEVTADGKTTKCRWYSNNEASMLAYRALSDADKYRRASKLVTLREEN